MQINSINKFINKIHTLIHRIKVNTINLFNSLLIHINLIKIKGFSQKFHKKLKKSRRQRLQRITATLKDLTRSKKSSYIMMMIFSIIKTYRPGLKGLGQSLFNNFFKISPTYLKPLYPIVSWKKIAHNIISLRISMNLFSQIRLKNLLFLLQITNFISSILKIRMFYTRRVMTVLFRSVGLILILPIHILCSKHLFHNLNWWHLLICPLSGKKNNSKDYFKLRYLRYLIIQIY